MLPLQVNPVVPAHVPSLEIFSVGLGLALLFVELVVDFVVEVVVGLIEVEEATFDELVEVFTELELDEPEQVPPTGLHPVPQ